MGCRYCYGYVTRIRLSDGRVYDSFRVPHPVQIHGMTIKDNVIWYCDDRKTFWLFRRKYGTRFLK